MVMKMDAGLDTGDVAMTARLPISATMTAGDLHDALAPLGAELMGQAMATLESGTLRLTPQGAQGVTYAAKIDKNETRIDWSRPALDVHNHCRGLSPFPGAWCERMGEGGAQRLKILRTALAEGRGAPGTVLDERLTVACGDGAIRILELQRAGKQPMTADEFLRGVAVPTGAALA
jgi:methionyl-tRNA formyltransferase